MASNGLPRRFQPLLAQARTQADLTYGPQGNLLAMLLGQAGHDLQKGITQAQGGAKVLQAGLERSRAQIPGNFQAAGLDTGSLPQTPDGNRIRETLANTLSELSLREAQAQEGAASGVRQARDAYSQDASKIKAQLVQLAHDRGLYTASTLDSLISGDRATRHAARMAALATQNSQDQAALDRASRVETALIGQGIAPDGSALPGGKADPKARAKKNAASKPTGADRAAITAFQKAQSWIPKLDNAKLKASVAGDPKRRRAAIAQILLTGDRQSNIPAIAPWALSAALDMHFDTSLSRDTVKKLHNAGVQVGRLPGVVTPGLTVPRGSTRRPANAPGSSGQLRPT